MKPVLARHHVLDDNEVFIGIVAKHADRDWSASLIKLEGFESIEVAHEFTTLRDASEWLLAYKRRHRKFNEPRRP